ncbi:ATP-binding protein [Prauserella oleivorans]|uniref:ATP-binding protein n=1 Tax=Prauserella oleivorans TaxID=1478153 RepID=A0ABW5W4V0_9PSEU
MTDQGRSRTDTLVLDMPLRVHPRTPTDARHAADEVLGSVASSTRQCFLLLVTELVTNAVVHGRPPFSMRMLENHERLRIEVADTAARHPVVRDPEPHEPTGRGMVLVAAMADDWGVQDVPTGPGKVVWAELRR